MQVAQAHADRPAVALDGVARLRLVDVRRQDLDAVPARVVDHEPRRVEAHRLVVEDGGGELGRIVGPQPCRRVAHHGEARGVRLVEAVGGKPLELPEHLGGDLVLDAVLGGAAQEVPADALHLLAAAALGHRAAQRVGLGQAEAGDRTGDEQHLLLVDDDAVGVGEHLAHALVRDLDRLQSVTPADERRDHLGFERTGAEQRYLRDDVFERRRLQPRRQVALAAALELEHPHGVRRGDHLVDARIVLGQVERLRDRLLAHACPRHLDRFADRRVGPQSQDVHLDQAERLDVVLVVLRDHGALGRPLQRRPARDGIAGDDEAAEVGAQVHRAVVELLGEVEEHPPGALVAQRVPGTLGIRRQHLTDLARTHPGQMAREPVDLGDGQPERLARPPVRRSGRSSC